MDLNISSEMPAFKKSETLDFFNRGKYRINLILFFAAILVQLFDIISTILCIELVGYGFEANLFIREIINNSGIWGFAIVKFCLAFLAMCITYFVIEHKDNFEWKSVNMFYGIYIGAIISSIFVTISNLSVVYAGNSLYLLDIDSLHIAVVLLFMAPLTGLFLDIAGSHKRNMPERDYFKLPLALTYDNPQFLKICIMFFFSGSILNLIFGIYASNLGYILNSILLGIITFGIWQVRKISGLKMNL